MASSRVPIMSRYIFELFPLSPLNFRPKSHICARKNLWLVCFIKNRTTEHQRLTSARLRQLIEELLVELLAPHWGAMGSFHSSLNTQNPKGKHQSEAPQAGSVWKLETVKPLDYQPKQRPCFWEVVEFGIICFYLTCNQRAGTFFCFNQHVLYILNLCTQTFVRINGKKITLYLTGTISDW